MNAKKEIKAKKGTEVKTTRKLIGLFYHKPSGYDIDCKALIDNTLSIKKSNEVFLIWADGHIIDAIRQLEAQKHFIVIPRNVSKSTIKFLTENNNMQFLETYQKGLCDYFTTVCDDTVSEEELINFELKNYGRQMVSISKYTIKRD